ncbi:hypothetical protein HYY69_08250 [Candidatus Woesearchaeota archaeon]|nr:hypothetical protein [Candidatus Woesearchaeota archaeon]
MMIKPFDYFVKENMVRKTISNTSMAKAFVEKATIRLNRIKEISEKESSIVFEDIYECLREAAQSLMELKGYKPYSHEALISFLYEEKLLSQEKIVILDNYRILRNNSVYLAQKISLGKTEEAYQFAKIILPEIKNKLDELLKNK